MITIMMIINNKKVTFHWFLLICISTLVLGRVDIGLRKGSCFSLIRENIVQLGVIFCKRTRYAGNDITQLAQSPQKWVFELCNYQRKVFGRINMSLDNMYIYFFVEQPSKDGSDILLSLVHSSLGENIWKPNAGFFCKLLVVNQFYFTQFFFAGFVFKNVRLSPQSWMHSILPTIFPQKYI